MGHAHDDEHSQQDIEIIRRIRDERQGKHVLDPSPTMNASKGNAFAGKPASFDFPPEDCYLVAHDTGDGWALGVENPAHEVIAYLIWPTSFGESQTAAELSAKGFIIV